MATADPAAATGQGDNGEPSVMKGTTPPLSPPVTRPHRQDHLRLRRPRCLRWFDQTFEVDANRMDFPTVQINSARRVEITATASSSGTGFWSCSQCFLMDMGRGGEKRFAGFGVLELGRTHTVSIDNLSGTSSLLLSAYTAQGGTVYKPIEGLVGSFPFFELPGPLTIRVVGYR